MAAEGDIAVIGIGCNFPGGEGLDHFWRVLLEGQNCVVDIPAERFDREYWFDSDGSEPGKTQTTKAALIDGLNEFDHRFFGMAEAEADAMDPQHKLLLECTFRALEDAGIPVERVSGSATGVYIGLMNRDYEMVRSRRPDFISHYSATGTAASLAANRISFVFNLTAASFAVDSACSSSLVAVHVACQAIRQGDCEMALCGGVNCILEPRGFVALGKAGMISPEGTSKPFSGRADGYGRGEGCGVVLLKPLEKALQDCNKIWGIIAKTAVNQDGHSVSPITKPSLLRQEELLKGIYSELDLADVQYIEAHGTGTPVGDQTEAMSISNVLAKTRCDGADTLRIGSVKGNIGHLESAAGVAGLIKVLLMMKHQTIVPTVFYSQDRCSIDAEVMRIRIPAETERWTTNGSGKRVAGINSFGFGGTNAHVIVREYKQPTNPARVSKDGPRLFVASAASEKSLIRSLTDAHRRLLAGQVADLQALSYTSACGRSHLKHKYRKAIVTSSLSELQQQVASSLKAKVASTKTKPNIEVVFVFCGNGVAFRGMCSQLLSTIPLFQDKLKEVEVLFQKKNPHMRITQWLSGECDTDEPSRPDVAQPLLFAVQVAIAALLKHWGVKPDTVMGHSLGEVAAAHCSGLLALEDAVNVVYQRSALQSKATAGKMLVVGNILVEKVRRILWDFSKSVCVAAFNSPQSCTLSGDKDAIDVLHDKLYGMYRNANIFLQILDVPAAYHSHLMDPILGDIRSNLGCLDVDNIECKLFSTVTGGQYGHGEFESGSYWAKNIREPVLFEGTLRAVARDNLSLRNVVFVEIGPRRALERHIHETLGTDVLVLPSVQPPKEFETLLSTVGKLFEVGVNVRWEELYQGYKTPPTVFPLYHFDTTKKEMYFEDLRKGNDLSFSSPHPLISQVRQNNKQYECSLTEKTMPYLWEHKHNGVAILPGAFYVELAFASLLADLHPKRPVSSVQLSVTFHNLLSVNNHHLKVRLADTDGVFTVSSSAGTHASGTFRCTDGPAVFEEPSICPARILKRCSSIFTTQEFYSILSGAGFEYGSVFKRLHDVHFGDEFKEAVTTIKVPKELLKHLCDYFIHPVLLDCFFQMTAVIAARRLPAKRGFPSAIGSVAISGPLQEEMLIYMRATAEMPTFMKVCGCFATRGGKVLVELQEVQITFLAGSSAASQSLFFHNEIIPIPNKTNCDRKIRALVFADKLGIAEGLGPYLHPESCSVEDKDHWSPGDLQDLVLGSNLRNVLFIWAAEDLSHLSPRRTLDRMVACCESFRQVVLTLKQDQHSCTVHVITYRSTERMVDCVSSGFVLSGMMRACAAEVPGISFQLIDLMSLTRMDIESLVGVIQTCQHSEVIVGQGKLWTTSITRTPTVDKVQCEGDKLSVRDFVLQTSHPYRVEGLTATSRDSNDCTIPDKSVEVQLTKVCVHSSDYFPVTLSQLNFGKTLYWSNRTAHPHTLLALDFSGIVTAVGKDVRGLKEGDRIASSYPAATATRFVIPESVCYDTKELPFLEECPSMSFFILAWEILHRTLPTVKARQQNKLTIITPDLASAFLNVLAMTANRSGWNVSCLSHLTKQDPSPDPCRVFVFLPPFDDSRPDLRDDGHERHAVFVCGTRQSSPRWENLFLFKSDFLHVRVLHVTHVLQRGYLRAQGQTIKKWLMSLGFNRVSLPIKRETFPISNTEKAQANESYFASKTVRQVVLDQRAPNCQLSDIVLHSKPRELFKKHCTYIVTGGLTGLGFETVKFIACNGGGHVVTLSRRTPTQEIDSQLDLIQKRFNITVMNIQCDVSASQQVAEAIAKTEQRLTRCPIKGVFHSAAVLHDAPIETINASLLQKVLQPKVSGALNLHHATLHMKLDFFVCFSSISSIVGNERQSSYAAANSFLDKFCLYRRNLGSAGQSINWGPLNLGLLLNKKCIQNHLEAKGMTVMEVEEIHEALAKVLLSNRPQQVVCKFNFQNPSLRERLSALAEAELKDKGGIEPPVPQSCSPHERVRRIVADVGNLSEDELDSDATLVALGVDSMLALTLQSKIFQETNVNVALVSILDPSATVATLEGLVINNNNNVRTREP